MNDQRLMSVLRLTGDQAAALDVFVECQREVAKAVRARDWAALERSLERAGAAADEVQDAERARREAWFDFLCESGLPDDATVFRASLALPVEYRAMLNDAYRALRLSAMRARIENDALSGFVGNAAATLRDAMETVFPERKGRIYGRSGRATAAGTEALVLDTAL